MRLPGANKAAPPSPPAAVPSGHRKPLAQPLAPITEWDPPAVIARKYGMTPPFTPQEFVALFGVIEPTPRPIGPAEQAVIDRFAEPLAELGAKVDLAMIAHTSAQQRWIDARQEQSRVKHSTPRWTDRATGKTESRITAAAAATSAALADYELACQRLGRLRGRFTTLQVRADRTRLVAQLHDEGYVPPVQADEDDWPDD